jgi:pimeloyl-ACP methyl ester carboxylesterase
MRHSQDLYNYSELHLWATMREDSKYLFSEEELYIAILQLLPPSASVRAMFSKVPTIFIIGGGWHTPQSYSSLNKQLELAGYEVHVPTLPSMNGSRPPNADLNTDTEHIRSVAEGLVDEGHNLIVFMHSYGGQIGTNALHGT